MIGRLAFVCTLAVMVVASLRTEPLPVAYAQQVTSTPTSTTTPTLTPTATASPTATSSPTLAPTSTPTPMPTATRTVDPPAQATATHSPIPTLRPNLAGLTPLATPTPPPTRVPTRTPTPTVTLPGVAAQLTPITTAAHLTPVTSAAQLTPIPLASVLALGSMTPTGTVTAGAGPAPVITDMDTTSITRSSVTITWTTNVPTSSQVDYGTYAVSTFHTPPDPSLVTAHRVVLTGLLASASYMFDVRGVTANGAVVVSPQSTLLTSPNGSGPEVLNPMPTQVTGTTATLGWTTATGTVGQVEYGSSANYGAFTLLTVFAAPTQQLTLSGLKPATLYHFRVKEWDAQGALGASGDAMFTTAPVGQATLFGDATVQPVPVQLSAGQATAYQYVAAQSGLASVVRLYIDAGSTAPVVRVALYSDQAGAPGTILAQSSGPSLTPGWITVTIPPVPLLQGTRYWVVVLNPLGAGSVNLRQASSGGSSVDSAQTGLAALPQPFVPGVAGARSPASVYVQQIPPSITLTGPTDGSVVTGQTTLSAVADDDAPITRMQFFVDGLPVGPMLTAAPYSTVWDAATVNTALPHTISAQASDVAGRTGASGTVTVQVDNGPSISNITVGPGLTASSARITWSTDVPSDGQVQYGLTSAYGLSTPVDGRTATVHDLQLTGLTPGATYHFRVASRDASGAQATSVDGVFFTSASE